MPLKHLSESLLSIALDGVSVAGNERIKVPRIDPLDALVEARPVLAAHHVPLEALHPLDVALGSLQAAKQLVAEAGGGVALALGRLGVLLPRGQVEEQIRLDKDTLGLEVEDELLVGVGVDVLVLEIGVKLGGDGGAPLLGAVLEDDEEFVRRVDLGVARLLGALLRQAVGADDLGLRVGGLVLGDEDVVLHVGGDDVGEVAALFGDFGLHRVGEGDGTEDGEGAGGEAD